MGNQKSVHYEEANHNVQDAQQRLDQVATFPMQVMVAHYTPPNFPMYPIISKEGTEKCVISWKHIMDTEVTNPDTGVQTSGITVFYREFYDRLDLMDSSGRFDAVLSKHSSSENAMAAKGAILLRIIKYVANISGDNDRTQLALLMLGKSHQQKGIRPWQYSTFVIVLLQTISSRLEDLASNDTMEAWVNLFAFVMRSMLPVAIKGQVVETEISVNTSSEFNNSKISEEIEVVEEIKAMKKAAKITSGRSSAQNSARSNAINSARVGFPGAAPMTVPKF
jgi:hemoglobin-like flavoprotein